MLNNQRVTFINMKNFPLLDENGKYQWAFDHDKIIREFAEWMHLEDGDLDMEDIDLDPV